MSNYNYGTKVKYIIYLKYRVCTRIEVATCNLFVVMFVYADKSSNKVSVGFV